MLFQVLKSGSGGIIRCPPSCPLPGLGVFYTPQCVGYVPVTICSIAAVNGEDGMDQNGDPENKCSWGAKDDCKACQVSCCLALS